MNTEQIYSLVNSVYSQMAGVDPITATDVSGLISIGNAVLSSNTNTEGFMNTLVQRIGRTIISERKYSNQFGALMMDNFQFGAIVQKLHVEMPAATSDDAYALVDGQAIDHYKVAKPTVNQKLFVTRTPYQFYVTIQDIQLQEAFQSPTAMGSFISAIFGAVQDKIEVTLEDLGRITLASFIARTTGARKINLVTDYNAATGSSLTAATALFDADFLRYAISTIKKYSKKMTFMSEEFNEDGYERHTPVDKQIYAVTTDFEEAMETVVQYAAFNKEFVSKMPTIEVPYWQASQTPAQIKIDPDGTGTVTVDNIVACLFDREACGTFKEESRVATTPMNAAGLYYNTYWHEKQLWFNDLSENFIVFTLN